MSKKILWIFTSAMFFLAGGFISCSESEDTDKVNTLKVSPTNDIQFKASGNDDVVLTITTDVKEWTYTNPSWVDAKQEGNTLIVNAKDNTTEALRSGQIEVRAGNAKPVIIQISQEVPVKGEDNVLSVDPSDAVLFRAADNDDVVLTVATDAASWEYEVPEWVIAAKDDQTLTINVEENTTDGPRSGQLTFTAGTAQPVVIDITQSEPVEVENTLTVDPVDDVAFEASGSEDVVLTITTDAESWSFKAPEWITGSKVDDKLTIHVEDNILEEARSGKLTISAGTAKPVVINISQKEFVAPVLIAGSLTDKSGKNQLSLQFFSENTSLTANLNFVLAEAASEEVNVGISVDAEYLAEYNRINGTDYQLFPVDLISIAGEGDVKIAAGATTSGNIAATFDTSSSVLQVGVKYLVPLCAKAKSENVSVADEVSRVSYILSKPKKEVKNIMYFEVNDVNPLNVLEYVLEDGSYFFDAIILFAGNINYNKEEDVVFLNNNENVQALLDQTDVYIQPIRQAGIKVYLGVLGNHDAAGLAQLSDWGAQQFSMELANAVQEYKLDGVNFDDEYSNYPSGGKWFTTPSNAAAARLCYETKKAMDAQVPWETHMSIFSFNKMQKFPSVDGHEPGEFVDFSLPNYGGYTQPMAGMTKRDCCHSSIELNRGTGNATESSGRIARTSGYGWYMWFGLDPEKNLNDSWGKFNNVSRGMYEQQVKKPTGKYKKTGPGQYDPVRYAL